MKLYKYHSFNKNSLAELKNEKIWASKPGHFNDPFDCRAKIFQTSTPKFKHITQKGRGRMRDIQIPVVSELISEDLTEEQSIILENMGVYCLTKDQRSSPMWGHYADSLRGFCLEYTFSSEEPAKEIEVVYRSKIPKLNQTLDGDALMRDAAKYKKDDWKYEKEYRLVYRQGDAYHNRPALITSIIFGDLMRESERNAVRFLLPEAKCQVAVPNTDTVEIDIVDR